jgi:hypothetical protein
LRFAEQVTNGAFQPLARRVSTDVDRDDGWQPGQKQSSGMALASEIAAHETSRLTSAARPKGRDITGQPSSNRAAAVDQL